MRDLKALVAPHMRAAVHVVPLNAPALSHFGGAPNLPADVPWPQRDGRRLAFLARISLAELQRAGRVAWLPQSGALLFFYDAEDEPWGFDPADRGACAVLHVPDLTSPVIGAEQAGEDEFIARRCAGFRRIDSVPSWERAARHGLAFTDDELDAYGDLVDAPYLGMPKHQVSGLPAAVQNDDMELQAQLVTNGLYCGDSSGYEDPRAQALTPGAGDWRLLLQFDTDDDLGVMWGDCGMLYFWVKEAQAARADFSNVWLILQCS
jgi:uncharacterized protein YwqG